MLRSIKLIIFGVLVILLLTSCAMFRGSAPQTTINLHAANYLNPDVNGRASPLVVTVFQLKSPFTFKQATFDQLMSNSSSVLGTDLIDKDSIEIQPNKSKQVKLPLSTGTGYIGVIAAYRNINQAVWRRVVKIVPNKNNVVNINLESEGIILKSTKKGFSL